MKKIFAFLTVAALLAFAGCGAGNTAPTNTAETTQTAQVTEVPYEQRTAVRVGLLNGPTGMGASKLIKDNDDRATKNKYTFEQFSAPTDIMPLLINNELDIAALPTNVAATIYNKTNGGVKLLALNTLGVLYVLSKDESIKTIEDLAGKTIYISGQGSTPEYALNYILTSNGLTDEDVTVEFAADHASIVSMCAAGKADTVVLPEPFVSTLLDKDLGYIRSIDLNAAWDEACKGQSIFSMGCLVVRSEFAEQNPSAVEAFLKEYAASVEYVNSNTAAAAELIAGYGIAANAALAAKALPNCNIVCITGTDMQAKTDVYLKLLHQYNPKSVGGAVPGNDFYYAKG